MDEEASVLVSSFEFRVSSFKLRKNRFNLPLSWEDFMATFKTFEEIECWKKARELTREIYDITNKPAFSRDFGLKDQIRRAAVSIMSNIAEGYDRSGTAEFVHFLATAKGSAAEVRCQLYVAADQGYIHNDQFGQLNSLAAETARMLSGLIKYLRASGYKGTKFKTTLKP
jgi:four helix bundle protein